MPVTEHAFGEEDMTSQEDGPDETSAYDCKNALGVEGEATREPIPRKASTTAGTKLDTYSKAR